MKPYLCLGIESTAHTFGVSVVSSDGKVLSNERSLFTTESGGIVPQQAAEHHVQVCDSVIKEVLKKANKKIKDIKLISFSQSPGLGHCLRIGGMVARSLASIHKKEIIGVNHCIAHLEIGRLMTKAKDPVLLYVSGANTQVIAYEGGKYRIFGETLDMGVGNFIDTFARILGLGFPGGPKIYELSLKGKNFVHLPYTVKGMDVSFSGILTNLEQKYKSGKFSKEDLAFSMQETVFAMLVEVAERAMAHTEKEELLLGGGVACNKRLQEMCIGMCEERGAKCFIPANEFLVDNAAMIAWQGILQYNAGDRLKIEKAKVDPYLRTDDINVTWR
jgi:N6-L-threonylcarbamoyladenine synthase